LPADTPNAAAPVESVEKRPVALFLYIALAVLMLAAGFLGTHTAESFFARVQGAVNPYLGTFLGAEFLKELCLAGAIALLAILLLERSRIASFTRELEEVVNRRLLEIQKTTTDAIFQGPLPRAYYEHVKSMMLQDRFLITDLHCTFRFVPRDHDPNHLRLLFDEVFKVKNLNEVAQPYVVESFESLDLDDLFPGTTRILYVRAKSDGTSSWLIRKSARPGQTLGTVEDGDRLSFKEKIWLQHDQQIVVEKGTEEIVRVRDMVPLVMTHPTIGVRFTVHHPRDIRFCIAFPSTYTSGEHDPHVSRREDGDTVVEEWDFPFPMVPSSDVSTWWLPEAPHVASPATGAAAGALPPSSATSGDSTP
jgi:hypothetical protein